MGKLKLPTEKSGYVKGPSGESKSKPEEHRRESPSGWHYYALYKTCPRKWYIKYILGLRPVYTKPPLIFGGVIHEAIAAYYNSGFNIDTLIETFEGELASRQGEYESSADFLDNMAKGKFMLDKWVSTWRDYDMSDLEILEVEKQYTLKVGPPEDPMDFTVRPDRVVRRKSDGRIVIPDVKTTGYAVDKAIQGAKYDDQLTSYVWAWNKAHPEDTTDTAQVDVMYARGKVAKAERSEDIIITRYALAQFEMGLYGLIKEITQKVIALKEFPNLLLFPRNGRECGLFGCEYEPICRQNITPDTPVHGFNRDPWVEVEEAIKKAQGWNLEQFGL